jgi:hypothetical protein
MRSDYYHGFARVPLPPNEYVMVDSLIVLHPSVLVDSAAEISEDFRFGVQAGRALRRFAAIRQRQDRRPTETVLRKPGGAKSKLFQLNRRQPKITQYPATCL